MRVTGDLTRPHAQDEGVETFSAQSATSGLNGNKKKLAVKWGLGPFIYLFIFYNFFKFLFILFHNFFSFQ